MNASRRTIVLIAIVLMAACASPGEHQAKRDRHVSALQERCAAYGFKPGTDAFADCFRREHLCERERARARYDTAWLSPASLPNLASVGK
jgi:hypothetical protein